MSGLTVALVGNPNSGKTALFNRLTGANRKVGNFAGVTVERQEGRFVSPDRHSFTIVDLPGLYSLNPLSEDEAVTKRVLAGHTGDEPIDMIVFVADSTRLKRTLSLAVGIASFGKPMVLALNMSDAAEKRHISIDTDKLSRETGIPVIRTTAVAPHGISELAAFLDGIDADSLPLPQNVPDATPQNVARIYRACVTEPDGPYTADEKIDRILLHPAFGLPVLFAVLFVMFQAVYTLAQKPMEWIGDFFSWSGETVSALMSDGPLKSLLVDGIIAGVSAIVVFLPQILILFFFILVLEESGYLPRAAFMLDSVMRRIGLSGHAFIPLLSGFACAVPAIMATRTIQSRRQRLLTIALTPLMTCSARLPVYTLVIGACIPAKSIGLIDLRGLAFFLLYAGGIFFATVIALLAGKARPDTEYQPLLLELPAYRLPYIKSIAVQLFMRAKIFLVNVSTFILATTIVLWALSSYPAAPDGFAGSAIEYSFAGRIGQLIEPLFRPLGFSWQIVVSLIPGMAAREASVGALGTVYSLDGGDTALSGIIASAWSLPTALSLLTWFVFAPQCFATLGIMRRETGSWRFVALVAGSLFALAYAASFAVYQVSSLLLGG